MNIQMSRLLAGLLQNALEKFTIASNPEVFSPDF